MNFRHFGDWPLSEAGGMRAAIRNLILFGGSGLVPINSYLLRIEFATDDTAPLANPYAGEVGDLVPTQTNGNLSVAAGLLSVPAASPAAFNVLGYYCRSAAAGGFARTRGRVLRIQKTLTTATWHVMGWHSAANINLAGASSTFLYYRAGGAVSILEVSAGAAFAIPFTESSATSYQMAFVQRSSGGMLFVKGGIYTIWTLLWSSTSGNGATLYPALDNRDNVMTQDYIYAYDWSTLPADDYWLATFTDTTLASGDTFTATADGEHIFEFTPNASPSAAEENVMYFRWTDDNNCWKAYSVRNAGNTDWDFKVDSIAAGAPTNRISITGIGAHNAIKIISEGTKHDAYTRATSTWTKRGSQINVSHQDAITGMKIAAPAGATLTRLTSHPRTSALYDADLNRV